MKKIMVLVLAVSFIVMIAVGCTATAGQKVYGKDDTDISVDTGQSFTIKLEENPTTGYQWSVSISDESIVKLENDYYKQEPTDKQLVGAGGYRMLTFKGLKQGNATITLIYERSFEEHSAIETIVYNVTVNE
ncbi:MAG: protease inhibitor I42 family protein [Christensenellales bacterium]|jgi:inhibitor of cysteine peptidase